MSSVSYIQCDSCKAKDCKELVTITFEKVENTSRKKPAGYFSDTVGGGGIITFGTSTTADEEEKSIDLCRKCLAEIPILRAMKI